MKGMPTIGQKSEGMKFLSRLKFCVIICVWGALIMGDWLPLILTEKVDAGVGPATENVYIEISTTQLIGSAPPIIIPI